MRTQLLGSSKRAWLPVGRAGGRPTQLQERALSGAASRTRSPTGPLARPPSSTQRRLCGWLAAAGGRAGRTVAPVLFNRHKGLLRPTAGKTLAAAVWLEGAKLACLSAGLSRRLDYCGRATRSGRLHLGASELLRAPLGRLAYCSGRAALAHWRGCARQASGSATKVTS